jgi:type I restriction enzyme S subunit
VSWPFVPLGDLIDDLSAGKSFGKANPPAAVGQWGIIKVSAMTWGEFRPEENKAVPADRVDPRFEIREGDLLVSRANTADYVGACVLVGPVRPRLLLSDKSLRLTPKPGVYAKWLWRTLQSPSVRRQIRELATGTKDSMRNISQAALREIAVPLPSFEEQRRIVELLEGHLSRLDAANAAVTRCIKRAAAMRDSFLARCVEEARSAPGASAVALGELAQVMTGTTPLKGNLAFYENGTIPWITSGDLHKGVIEGASQFVTELALRETSLKLIPAGALLIAMYGEGRTRGTVAELAVEASTNQACAAVVFHDQTLRPWVRLVLEANYGAMRRMAAGGVQPNLNLSLVRSIQVPVPPEPVRTALLSRLNEIEDRRRRFNAELSTAETRSSRLRRSLLASAFSGG